jgi:hypothetical protein
MMIFLLHRCSAENVVAFGFWFGEKPNWTVFLRDIISEIKHLGTNGFQCKIGSSEFTVKVRILSAVFDLVAKASILNVKQFNGNKDGQLISYSFPNET